jgi:hypothetical protein
MKKLIALPKKRTIQRHAFVPAKANNHFPTDTDPTSITVITTTHV